MGKSNDYSISTKNNVIFEEEWFLGLSSASFGIHQRAEKFVKELHHSSRDLKKINEKIREIALSDIWFYKSQKDAVKALKIILVFFRKILDMETDFYHIERTLNSLLEFTRLMYEDKNNEKRFLCIIIGAFKLMEDTINGNQDLFLHASTLLKILPDSLVESQILSRKIHNLFRKSLQRNLKYWKNQLDFKAWCKKETNIFNDKFSALISNYERELIMETELKLGKVEIKWHELKAVPGFKGFTNRLRDLIEETNDGFERIYYIFYLLHLPFPFHSRDFIILDLNMALKTLSKEEMERHFDLFIPKVFSIFEKLKNEHMEKILDCILTLGRRIYSFEDPSRIDLFIEQLIDFGFVYPEISGIDQDWQILIDRNHIKSIRVWLELIQCSPRLSRKLIAALIVNLKVGGIFIRDNDLFQRDITKLLNSDFESCYILVKQLTYLFPVYFKSIGAEGEIREITTFLDKQSYRKDQLIHFLRKQVHTESNNTHIELIEKIFWYWYDGNTQHLLKYLPPDVRNSLNNPVKKCDPVHRAVDLLCKKMHANPSAILEKDIQIIQSTIQEIDEIDKSTAKKILYMIELYGLLKQKYTLDPKNIIHDLKNTSLIPRDKIENLEKNLRKDRYAVSIKQIFSMISRLREILLNKEKSRSHEDIYYKRHIVAGIPSMYGQYSEIKFESLGFIFRLERLADKLISQFISQRNLAYMTIDGFHNAAKLLDLFKEGLKLNGITSENFNSNLEMLHYSFKTSTFSMDQFVNIFYFLTLNIKEIIENYYMNPFNSPLRKIIPVLSKKKQKGINISENRDYYIHKRSEEFFRKVISSAFLVQHLDNYLSRIMVTLREMTERLNPEVIHMLLNYNPKLLFSSFYQATPEVNNQTFLGAKAYYLKKLYSYKFPVPPGFVLTTEWFRDRKAAKQFPEMYEAILRMVEGKIKEIEGIAKKKFGDLKNPLLLAVRSGTVISMPGAMDSLLNIGMNDQIAESLSERTGYGWAAWDSYRRLLQNWGMAHGISRDEFDRIIADFKKTYQVREKKTFSNQQMKSIALSYKELLRKRGVTLEEDPFKQLLQAINFVFQSWYNQRAKIYRKKLQIADEWGTAVIVQEMVFGNINYDSGTGVVFTKIPFEKSSEVTLYGDFSRRSQGEDIVSGLVHTLPVSEFQNKHELRLKGNSLEIQFPEIYQELLRLAKELVYKRGYEHQEIEFTFKSKYAKDLYILQTRNYILKDKEVIPIFTDPSINQHFVGTGIGIGKGAMNGLVAFNMEDLKMLAEKYPKKNKILIRPDTVPDDIAMIFECDGLLTARGGVTSHAAVTAAQLGKTCVVNCRQLVVLEQEKKCLIGKTEIRTGDEIAIDAHLGNIYKGNYSISSEQISLI